MQAKPVEQRREQKTSKIKLKKAKIKVKKATRKLAEKLQPEGRKSTTDLGTHSGPHGPPRAFMGSVACLASEINFSLAFLWLKGGGRCAWEISFSPGKSLKKARKKLK